MALFTITVPTVLGALTAALNMVTSTSDTIRSAIESKTPVGDATAKLFVEALALPLAILTKLNQALHIDPLQLDPSKGLVASMDTTAPVDAGAIEAARAALASLM